ncbi:hypothetical protein T484DRAFT_3083956 [Baffinella frigidus]|nr:hypothetical protein T484DRAFT_3083956 [Cryptophyta sp. CCMP2293]
MLSFQDFHQNPIPRPLSLQPYTHPHPPPLEQRAQPRARGLLVRGVGELDGAVAVGREEHTQAMPAVQV